MLAEGETEAEALLIIPPLRSNIPEGI